MRLPGELKDLLNRRSSVSPTSSFDRPACPGCFPPPTPRTSSFPLCFTPLRPRHGDYIRRELIITSLRGNSAYTRPFSSMVFRRTNFPDVEKLHLLPRRGLFGSLVDESFQSDNPTIGSRFFTGCIRGFLSNNLRLECPGY